LSDNIPILNGLILAGGRSSRMGQDKGSLIYYDKEQREHTADLIKSFCDKTYISCRQDQDIHIQTNYDKIYDTAKDIGPLGGLLAAFKQKEDCAWLIVACDLIYLNKKDIELLVESRDGSKLATCFIDQETKFIEPLVTIWEPKAYPVILEYYNNGNYSPSNLLRNSDIKKIEVPDQMSLKNINHKHEREEAKRYIKKS